MVTSPSLHFRMPTSPTERALSESRSFGNRVVGTHGSNQYRRVSLEEFFAAQRARVEQCVAAHARRLRARLLELEREDDFELRN